MPDNASARCGSKCLSFLRSINVAVRPDCRVQGVGRQLVEWVLAYGREQGCITAELNCYITNEAGQKFWEKTDFKAIGYHYQIRLS